MQITNRKIPILYTMSNKQKKESTKHCLI